jgi:hypothetical protein
MELQLAKQTNEVSESEGETLVDTKGERFIVKRKIVVRIGNPIERTPERKTKRGRQALEVLKAFLKKPSGYTDAELCAEKIGGTDGPRRRRELCRSFGVDFTKTKTNDITRWTLTDSHHAQRVLDAGGPVEID